MKKRNVIVILLMLVLCFASCGKQGGDMNKFDDASMDEKNQTGIRYETKTQKIIRELDEAYEKESSENFSTNDFVDVYTKYAEKWDRISEEYYDKLVGRSPAVAEMKANWEEYAEKQFDNYAKFVEDNFGDGTIGRIYRASYVYSLHRDWAVQLLELYSIVYQDEK